MKYKQPMERAPEDILEALQRDDLSPSDRIDLVLSAIYGGDGLEFAGDVMIKEFSEARYEEKIYLKNLFGTFHQMRRTAYRIDESIRLLSEFKQDRPQNSLDIDDAINELVEYKAIFANC
ncbi:hypothetical protein J2W22_003097 [Sphingomonas kyeonggiensis]|uniref:hypothetical protein n=1 Tax=Sphingomonas kyeonggiensis TaxID=1268553 RepID=UPI00278A82B7|nr:hypothetical protein [Sphingomonas kyeonggiensis]MDQ0251033.1 hypothetical protein [Sphingomonas kyeonggiensis]